MSTPTTLYTRLCIHLFLYFLPLICIFSLLIYMLHLLATTWNVHVLIIQCLTSMLLFLICQLKERDITFSIHIKSDYKNSYLQTTIDIIPYKIWNCFFRRRMAQLNNLYCWFAVMGLYIYYVFWYKRLRFYFFSLYFKTITSSKLFFFYRLKA